MSVAIELLKVLTVSIVDDQNIAVVHQYATVVHQYVTVVHHVRSY